MPSAKSERKEKKKKGRLSEKAWSFHGRDAAAVADLLPRPRTVPDLLAGRGSAKLTKLLVNVTIQRSPGPVHVLMPPDATVQDLITAAIRQYLKEARRPVLPSTAASSFDLHYSQFSLESLDKEVKVMELGSRNFFLCPTTAEASSCSKEAEEGTKKALPWLKFMDFLL